MAGCPVRPPHRWNQYAGGRLPRALLSAHWSRRAEGAARARCCDGSRCLSRPTPCGSLKAWLGARPLRGVVLAGGAVAACGRRVATVPSLWPRHATCVRERQCRPVRVDASVGTRKFCQVGWWKGAWVQSTGEHGCLLWPSGSSEPCTPAGLPFHPTGHGGFVPAGEVGTAQAIVVQAGAENGVSLRALR